VYIATSHFKSIVFRSYIYKLSNNEEYSYAVEMLNSIAEQICLALAYLHANKVTHEDIKPENIVVNKYGEIKVCDLGLSKMEKMPLTLKSTTGKRCHETHTHMCPRVFMYKEPWSNESDMFSVGCLLYELYLPSMCGPQ